MAGLGRHAAVASLAGALTLPSGAAAASCPNAGAMPSAANVAKVRLATLCLVNQERTRRGRAALRSNRELAKVANAYAAEMVRRRFFAHVSPGGTTLTSRVKDRTSYLSGVTQWALGENLAWGSGERASAQQTVRAWMSSPGHRRIILDRRFRDLGVGIALGTPAGGRGATYATDFGIRR
jgi:uncharacterized protein YkwD